MGIYGPWGSGKSTMLNFIEHYLKDQQPTEQATIVLFNPWWFSGREDLTRSFFSQLQWALSRRKEAARS